MADAVNHPDHYTAFPVEVIEIIKATLGRDGFRAYCFGNEIKYRMRAGLKGGKAAEDLDKAMTYKRFREVADEPPIFISAFSTGAESKFADNNAEVEADMRHGERRG